MATIYIPQAVAQEGVDYLLAQGYEIKHGKGISAAEMQQDAAGCEAILLRTALLPASVLRANPQLKIVARHGVGYDNIDIAAATALGIQVTNTPQALSDSVAEFTLGLILSAAKNLRNCSAAMYAQDYTYKNSHKGIDLCGKTLGVVGFGRIGRAVAKKAAAGLEMKVLAYDPFLTPADVPEYVTLCDWNTLFETADVVSLHLPGGAQHQSIVAAAEFKRMKSSAILLNVARGEVVNEADLAAALVANEIRCAVLDVQSQEPPAADYPLYPCENAILTPHMASNTEECMARMALHAAWQIHKQLSGERVDWPVNQL